MVKLINKNAAPDVGLGLWKGSYDVVDDEGKPLGRIGWGREEDGRRWWTGEWESHGHGGFPSRKAALDFVTSTRCSCHSEAE